jgi:hypothetical protein
MSLSVRCSSFNNPASFGTRPRSKKHTKTKYDFDKKLYRRKVQSAMFVRQDKELTLQVMQDLIDMSQYFKDEDVLYEVLTEMETDLFFYEICTWYRKIRG